MSFFEELKRRNVFRVGIAYAIAAWVLLQVADLVLDNINAPDWVIQAMMLMVGLGFMVALVIAWAYELTPEGIKREVDVDRGQSVAPQTGQKLDRIVIGFLVIAVLVLLYRQSGDEEKGSEPFSESGDNKTAIAQDQERALTPFPPSATVAAQPPRKSIAVLPFVNMSSDPEQEYFSDGITEEILNRLAKIPGLQVAARTSVFSFKGQNKDIRELAEMLGVSTMLEGSVRRDGEQVRITAQLIRASDGFHLWSETYDRKIESIFAVQDEISEQIAEALQVSLGITPPTANRQTNPEVYDFYLRARALFRQRGASVLEALHLFQRAVEIDPDFAPAWAGLAHTYTVLFAFLAPEEFAKIEDPVGKSREAAQRALALDPELPTALHAMANYLLFQYRWAESEEYFQKAMLLDPDSTDLMEDYAHFLAYSWQPDKAGVVADRMTALDPFVPIFRFAAIDVAQIQGDFEKRDEHIRKGLEVNPGFSLIQTWQLRQMMEQKRFDEAREYTDTMNFRGQATASGMRQLVNWVENPAGTPNGEMHDALAYMPEMALLADDYPLFMKTVWTSKKLISNETSLALMLELAAPARVPWSGQLLKLPQAKELITQARLPEYWRQVGWPSPCRPVGADDFECL